MNQFDDPKCVYTPEGWTPERLGRYPMRFEGLPVRTGWRKAVASFAWWLLRKTAA